MAENSSGAVEGSPLLNNCYIVEVNSHIQIYPISIEFIIGRGMYSDLQLSSYHVSRKHCEIVCASDGWKIRNKSTNGTWVNGRMLNHSDAVNLNNSDILAFGDIYIQCFLCVDKERFYCPINLLRMVVLVGKDRCILNIGQHSEPQSGKSIEKNNDRPDEDENAIIKYDIEMDSTETGNAEKSTKMSQQETVAENLGENILIEQLELLRKNNLILMKELKDSNIALAQAVLEKEKAFINISQLKQEISCSLSSKIEGLIETELQCSICHEVVVNATTPNCTHTFCEYCLLEWTNKNNICPICRTAITSHNRSKMIDNFIEKILLNLPKEIQEKRQELIESRKELMKKLMEKRRPRKRKRTAVAASSGGRQAITIALQNLANLMDTTIDVSSDDESPVFLFQQRLRP